MGVIKDPAIKLFGKTIPLLPRGDNRDEQDKDLGHKEVTLESENNEQEQGPESGEKIEPPSSSTTDSESQNQENLPAKDLKSEESPKETNSSQEEKTTLKKPDKILPCPRCKSLDTKFCYFNNYNVNQPRHFCKNCQRYWTAGGTMRNVPVGAGRRKNKNSASHYHYRPQTVPVNHPLSKPNGTVLSFGTSDTPLCESMASVLNIAEKGIHRIDEKAIPFSCGVDSIDEQPTGSSTLAPSTSSEEPRIENRGEGVPIPIPIPCFNGSPWPYPMNPIPAFSFPMYPPTAYWGCAVPGPWAIPSCLPPGAPSYSPRSSSSGSGPNSPNLGKHSREGDDDKQSKQERCLWIPKTLRIDNPDEAAKSSIWAIVGVKNAKADAASSGGGMFKAFQTKPETKIHRAEDSQVLHANPAALSRSLSFQESS